MLLRSPRPRWPLVVVGMAGAAALVAGCGSSPTVGPSSPTSAAPSTVASTGAATVDPTVDPTTSSPQASPAPSSAAVGTVLATLSGDGRLNIIPSRSGFDLVNSVVTNLSGDDGADQSRVVAYAVDGTELATVEAGSLTGECGAADVTNSLGRLVLTEKIVKTEAAGITPATWALTLTAWSADSGDQAWTTTVVPASTEELGCTAYDGRLQTFGATADGAWGAFTAYDHTAGVDLTTGRVYPDADVAGVLGDSLLLEKTTDGADGETTTRTLAVPPTWSALGSVVSDAPGRPDLSAYGVLGPPSGSIVGTGDGVGLTPSATTLVAATPQDGADDAVVSGFALPGVTRTWTRTLPSPSFSVVGINDDLALLDLGEYGTTPASIIAVDVTTGGTKWTLPEGGVCGLTSTQMLLSVNDQLAVIDLADGKQLSYSASPDAGNGCATVLPGGFSASGDSGTVTVQQVLTP